MGLRAWVVVAVVLGTAAGADEAAAPEASAAAEAIDLAAADLAAGEALYAMSCKNCHGPKAQGMASFPKLDDKDAAHLVLRLEQYRAGEKVGPNSALMQPNAEKLSDADIANLAAFITTGIE